jgi:endoglucanase Acf2
MWRKRASTPSRTTPRRTTRGTNQLSINGTNVGPVVDQYNAGQALTSFNLGTFHFATAGNYWFKFTVTGRNAASSGFTMAFDDIILTPQ